MILVLQEIHYCQNPILCQHYVIGLHVVSRCHENTHTAHQGCWRQWLLHYCDILCFCSRRNNRKEGCHTLPCLYLIRKSSDLADKEGCHTIPCLYLIRQSSDLARKEGFHTIPCLYLIRQSSDLADNDDYQVAEGRREEESRLKN